MLNLTSRGSSHTCNGTTRRDFLQVGTLGAIGLGLPELLAASERGAIDPSKDKRSCIMIFNLGAPSQLDTFDMKPEAPAEVRGPFKAISTKGDFQVSEILPRHAEIADKFSVIRSCYHTAAAVHDAGWQMLQTGRQFTGGVNYPHAGAVLQYMRGRRSDLPAHVVLPETMGRGGGNLPNGQAGGFLGKAFDPFALMADPSKENFKVPDLLPPPTLGDVRIDRRRRMRDAIEGRMQELEATESAKMLDKNFEAAYRLMSSSQARDAFDLTKEPVAVRERYGMESIWSVLSARKATDRCRRTIRDHQHFPDRLQRDHLGYPRQQALHHDRRDEEHRRPDVRPGLCGTDFRSRRARHARRHHGLWPR